jgi:hypothetical protein
VVRLWPGEEGDELLDSELAAGFGGFYAEFVRETVSISGED